jgi:uncharacterized protein with HEPN domain
MRDDRERLLDMLEAIRKIEQITSSEKYTERLQEDELVEVWVVHHLQIIGEAASRLSKEFREKHIDVAWGSMIGMRHVLVHGYFETDTEIVWKVVEKDLPTLKEQLETILAEQV